MRKMFRRIHYLLNRGRLERELEDEMAAHREMMPEDRRRTFGNTLRLREEVRENWGWLWLDHARQDLAYGVRGFIRDRRFTMSAFAAIALAVGAATAIFSVVDRSLFRALPYYQGDRLVSVGLVVPHFGPGEYMFLGAYREWRISQSALDLTSWGGVIDCDFGVDSPQRLSCARIEATLLPTLGVQPSLGRNFTPEEDRQGGEPVALISYGLWRTAFGADPGALGKRMTLDGTSRQIIGVLPAGFETPDLNSADVFVPMKLPPGPGGRNVPVTIIGRLRPGHTVESASAALAHPMEVFRADFGTRVGSNVAKGLRLQIEMLRDQQIRQYRLALWMLLGAVGAIVLIACANVTNLLLARSAGRWQEFTVRAALGASRSRLIRQTLTESGLLGVAGGVAGCGLALCLLRALIALAPDGTLRLRQAALDSRVLAFALILSLGTALVFGIAPSFDRLRPEALGGVRAAGHRRTWLRQALITSQLSVSLLLLTGAGLLLMSLWRLQNAPLGFERERIVTATFTLPVYRYAEDSRQVTFFNQLGTRLDEVPGAVAVAISDSIPPGAGPRTAPYNLVKPQGGTSEPGVSGAVKWRYVTPSYFEALGIPIRRGRGFSEADRQPGVRNIVVSESLARRLGGGGDPVGARLGANTIVGVAGDVRNAGLDRPADPEFYVVRKASRDGIPGSSDPAWGRRATVIVRSVLAERDAVESLRTAMKDMDPAVPVQFGTMDKQVDRFLTRPRFQTALLSVFAATGLLLAGIGLYGLISFLVADRTKEIGVRMVLGATPGTIAKLVVSDGLRWTGAGVVIGTVASVGLLRLLQGLLYEVNTYDLRVFAGAVTVLVTVAILAAWIPGRRASRIEPVIALRHD